MAWAEYFEAQKVDYAFFSATDAVAALEQAEKHRRREAGEDYEEDEAEEDEEDEGEEADEHADDCYEDGDEVGPEEEKLSDGLREASLTEGEEDGCSIEGEGDDDEEKDGEVDRLLTKYERLPLEAVVREVQMRNGDSEEDIRTRVLSVTELEDLFENAAPDLQCP